MFNKENRMFKQITIQSLLLLMITTAAWATPQLLLGPGSSNAGTVIIPVILSNEKGVGIASVGMDISYDSNNLEAPTVIIGAAADSAGKHVSISTVSLGIVRLGAFGFNTTAIGNGVVANITFAKKTAAKTEALHFKYLSTASNPVGDEVVLNTTDLMLVVE